MNQRNKSQIPLGNTFLALGGLCLGIFTLSTIIYSIIAQELVIIVFLKIGMVFNMLAVLFLFYTMLVLVYSSRVFKTKGFMILIPLISFLFISAVLIISNYIIVIDARTAETHFEPIP